MKAKLTDAALSKYKPKTARDEIFDKEKPGFGVRVTATSKSLFYIRRVRGQKVRFDLGRFLPKEELAKARKNAASTIDVSKYVSLAEARKKAQEILIKIESGTDPREEVNARKQAQAEAAENTFAHTAKRFITEYCKGKKRPLKPGTIAGYKWALQGDLTAKWAARPISAIAEKDIGRILDQLEADKHFASARLFRAYMHKFFAWCAEKRRRLVRENPVSGIELDSKPEDFKRGRFLEIPELQAVVNAADGLVKVKTRKDDRIAITGEVQRAFIRTLILTGQRRTETALMKWADLDFQRECPVWKIPAENTKNRQAHEVSLPDEAVAIISQLQRLGDYVFTTDGKTRISGYSKIKKALDKAITEAGVTLEPWRIHDLRRSVSTGLGKLGFAPHVIEMVMNHISGEKAGVSGLYNRAKYENDCRLALAAWANAVTAKDAGGNVVPMRAARST
jgi:integrase